VRVLRLGISIVLIALGAASTFVVSVASGGVAIHDAGVVLLILGGLGLLIPALRITFWGQRRRRVAVIERPDTPSYRAIKS
jgi:hypothetical protein